MKKLLCLLLAVATVLALSVVPAMADAVEINMFIPSPEYADAVNELIAAYKEFSALVNEAKVINDLDARYAAFAKAEACMLDHCLVVPAYVNVGWTLTKVNPYSQIYCAYGMMTYRYVNYDSNSDGYTTAEVEELKAAYNAK